MMEQHELQTSSQEFATGGRGEQHGSTSLAVATLADRKIQAGRAGSNSSLSNSQGSNTSSSSSSSSSSVASHTVAVTALPAGSPADGTGALIPPSCHAEAHAEYQGGVVQWGDQHLTASAAACCEACQTRVTEGCNVWVWCGQEGGCGPLGEGRRKHKECWLKKADVAELLEAAVGKGHPGIAWTSGVLASNAEWDAAQAKKHAKEVAEAKRLAQLRDDVTLPLVWLDVAIKGKPIGRMEFVLFTNTSPWAAENMRRMCTGEVSPRHTLKGARFYRIIDQFIDQTGVEIGAALGGTFKDDPEGLKLVHDRKGLLSVANGGHDTNTGHFSILMGSAPHLNHNYVIFGELVSGWEVAEAVNALSRGQRNNELLNSPDAVITDVGQLRQGTPLPADLIAKGLVQAASAA
ncbi:cyclophilin-like domain-containing protein [Haematococcus lacustris]